LSSSLRAHFSAAPNNILRHTVIEDLLNGSREALHFGGGLTNDESDSLFQFKRQFSSETATFHIGALIADRGAYQAIVGEWEEQHPDAVARFQHYTLKYRHH